MDQKFLKANELLADPSFVGKLKLAENHSEVQALFAENGASLEIADIDTMCKVACENCDMQNGELTEENLDNVAGGILLTASAAACFVVSSCMLGFFTSYGYRTIKSWRR